MDIHSTITKIKEEYKKYLKETHPTWSDSTVRTHASDAYYIWNNTISVSFWKCLKDEDSMAVAKQEILRHLADCVKSDRAETRANAYYADLSMLKEFLDTKYGGVEAAVGAEYDCERTIYKFAKDVYDKMISLKNATIALHKELPQFSEASYRMILTTFQIMMEGRLYTRRPNVETTVCFLENIAQDYGQERLIAALESTYQNICYYYEHTGSSSIALRRACAAIANDNHINISFDDSMFSGITPKQGGSDRETETTASVIADETVRYWLYAPGEGSIMWEEFYTCGEMGIGWAAIGDLLAFESKEEMKQAMKDAYNPALSYMNAAHATWQFANEIKVGDVIFVKKGRNQIIGRGVVAGDYCYCDANAEYPHRRSVNWTHKGEWPHPGGQAAMKTLTDVTPYTDYVEKLCGLFVSETEVDVEEKIVTFPEYTEADFLSDVYMEADAYAALVELIRTKKNVILQGAPGVGKTFAAKRLAYSMMGVKDQNRVMMIQFHQSYSYEDFIMGFRPAETGFELKRARSIIFVKRQKLTARMNISLLLMRSTAVI